MQLNLEPLLPNVTPTPFQNGVGHTAVGLTVAAGVHTTAKPHPLVSIAIGVFAGWIHSLCDAPASQVIAGAWAKFA